MKDKCVIVFDTETTGLSNKTHEIIEIAGVKIDTSLNIVDEFETKISPQRIEIAEPRALEINGFTKEAWVGSPNPKIALQKFADWASGNILCGHNVEFDLGFLFSSMREYDIPFAYDGYLCTYKMARKYKKEIGVTGFSLKKLCLHFDIPYVNAHRAMPDVKATLNLYKKLKEVKDKMI